MTPEQEAMEILMTFAKKNAVIMDSGGKDSSVLKRIAEKCREQYGFQFMVRHNHTGLDAPETVYFIRRERERERAAGIEYEISYPGITFEELCLKKQMLPKRNARFCCEYLKEKPGKPGDRNVTGVRKAESVNRKRNQGAVTITKKGGINGIAEDDENFTSTPRGGIVLLNYDNDDARRTVEQCFRTNRVLINPMINWTDDDVWRYIREENIPLNPLYECGFNRVGCVGCPMAQFRVREIEFQRYPKYKERYIRIAEKIVEQAKDRKGADYNGNGLEYFKRWMEDPTMTGQLEFDIDGNITEHY